MLVPMLRLHEVVQAQLTAATCLYATPWPAKYRGHLDMGIMEANYAQVCGCCFKESYLCRSKPRFCKCPQHMPAHHSPFTVCSVLPQAQQRAGGELFAGCQTLDCMARQCPTPPPFYSCTCIMHAWQVTIMGIGSR